MVREHSHNETGGLSGKPGSVIDNTRIEWSRSKEQVWLNMEKAMGTSPKAVITHPVRMWVRYSAAAVVTLMVGISALIAFYTKSVSVPAGKHAELFLPDNSRVSINAQSIISYKPLAWRFSRKVKFEGEGFFEVIKGNKFEVVSENGTTVVMGTSFNIYSRDKDYKVTCLTGRVKVLRPSGSQEVILTPGKQTYLETDGALSVESVADTTQTLSWMNNILSFTSEPLQKVFDEIARQYGVKIKLPAGLSGSYTGTFIKDSSAGKVLNLVCRPFEMEVTCSTKDVYVITLKNKEQGE